MLRHVSTLTIGHLQGALFDMYSLCFNLQAITIILAIGGISNKKLQHKLLMLQNAPSRWPTFKAETCRSIN